MTLSPMMQQYMEIKEKYQDCILFFRLGDFYEMFFDDAITVSRELEIVLTGKNCGLEERAPMCGVPFHSCDTYIAKLIEKGYKIAICEQTEDPALAKGLVKREVVQIITPGTVTNPTMLDEKENNYLVSIFIGEKNAALTYCDVSTGEICATDFSVKGCVNIIVNELVRLKAKEVLITEDNCQLLPIDEITQLLNPYINCLPESMFETRACEELLLRHFKVSALSGIGLGEERPAAAVTTGALLAYLFDTQKQSLSHLSNLAVYEGGSHMVLDKATIRNLELTETLYEKKTKGSLLGVLDKTCTAMGSRKMKQWIREPLNRAGEIKKRLDAVEYFYEEPLLCNNLRVALRRIYDLERLAGRIACGSAGAKDLIALHSSVSVLPEIKEDLQTAEPAMIRELCDEIGNFSDIEQLISTAIVEEPPQGIKEGGLIKDGYSQELDALKASIKDAQLWIANLENTERERTGIKNIKVGFNKVFGYYIEVTKSNYSLIPENYIRKQTLVNCERFITPELKETEGLVLNAESKINQLEYDLFCEIRSRVQTFTSELQKTASAVAQIDTIISFADVSAKLGYTKPEITEGDDIYIKDGRHPVIEQTIKDGIFVANDVFINCSDTSMLLITGPNMAGKSTYMRQNALIVLMAQAGCFVPCTYAKIGVVDRIFTRIGASDNLAQGQSTFFVEMSELAYILNCSTDRSLVILDEIGRGTSTYDGLSIAWAVVDYLCSSKRKCRTFFATHYHELTALEGTIKGCHNLNVDVAEENGNVVFLHKIVEGAASQSYGIHVAKLAGVPGTVLKDARRILESLEEGSRKPDLHDNFDKPDRIDNNGKFDNSGFETDVSGDMVQDGEQISFINFTPNTELYRRIKSLNLMEIKPSEAIGILEELQALAKK